MSTSLTKSAALLSSPADYTPILTAASTATFTLIGEASHGTHEFYHHRAELTKRLITDHGYTAIAVEADWPDAYRINRYIKAESTDGNPEDALADFTRFPRWMWRNTVVRDFIAWLRQYNDSLTDLTAKVGFYGLDLYSMHTSIDAVLQYLDQTDPEAAARARHRYSCFDKFGDDPQAYGYLTSSGMEDCEDAVIRQLVELRSAGSSYLHRDGLAAADELFFAEQNAQLIANAERYYRSMFRGRTSSWNLRDTHMTDTLDALHQYLCKSRNCPRIVVWEHNSHLGDARATEKETFDQVNVGQLVRERHPNQSIIVGFSTHTGSVTAATDWGDPPQRKTVRPSLPNSYERLFHETGLGNFLLDLRNPDTAAPLMQPRLQRAIGVIYRPETERQSHYYHVTLPNQFDFLIHLDQTRALHPLDPTESWISGDEADLPESYPSGL